MQNNNTGGGIKLFCKIKNNSSNKGLNKLSVSLTCRDLDAATWWVHEDHSRDALLHLGRRVDGAERPDNVRVRLVRARSYATQQES